ncbi:hypothetical protein QQF64_025501 [Cirrhinus molitorella]|uniref:Mono(ADP-ribosyl)transferase n=1 Tax=Cirrhinus molitorella TaxID=172907 RepID=A0ABR3NQ96_9TELE
MLLIIEALLLISAALGQDHRAAGVKEVFPLDMAPNSVDDYYDGCTKEMANLFPDDEEVLVPPYETFNVTAVKRRADQKDLCSSSLRCPVGRAALFKLVRAALVRLVRAASMDRAARPTRQRREDVLTSATETDSAARTNLTSAALTNLNSAARPTGQRKEDELTAQR